MQQAAEHTRAAGPLVKRRRHRLSQALGSLPWRTVPETRSRKPKSKEAERRRVAGRVGEQLLEMGLPVA